MCLILTIYLRSCQDTNRERSSPQIPKVLPFLDATMCERTLISLLFKVPLKGCVESPIFHTCTLPVGMRVVDLHGLDIRSAM